MTDIEKLAAMNDAIKEQYHHLAHNSSDIEAKFILDMMIADRAMHMTSEDLIDEAEQILHIVDMENIKNEQ